jgi:hypothetical protein
MGIVPHEVVVVAQKIGDVSVGIHRSLVKQVVIG